MPKFIVTYTENYQATVSHEVEAENEEQARDIANDLQCDSGETPSEMIELVDWEYDDIVKVEN